MVYNGDDVPDGLLSGRTSTCIAHNFTEAAEAIGRCAGRQHGDAGSADRRLPSILPLRARDRGTAARLVKNLHLFAIDRRALERGGELMDESARQPRTRS